MAAFIAHMKNLLLLGLVLSSLCLFGQTTMEEYNYLTKGYKIQMESGLDMKKGYSMREVDEWGTKRDDGSFIRSSKLLQLYRDGESEPCAGLIIFFYPSGWSSDYHYQAIPHIYSDDDVWGKAKDDFKSSGLSSSTSAYDNLWPTIKMISRLATPNAAVPGSQKAYGPDENK